MGFVVIVPARMTSTRLKEKPLADICGKPMVVRTAERAFNCGADAVYVACDSQAIVDACAAHGIKALLTDPECPTGTDRLAEAVAMLGLPNNTIVVNVQGDEPLIPTEVIGAVAQELEKHTDCAIATAAHPISDAEHFFNPNVVKVEIDAQGRALTFSRAPLPWPRDAFKTDRTKLPEGLPAYHHIGLYAYRAGFLKAFPKLTPAPIEKFESLEQLRALWHGYRISVMVLNENLPSGVDTAEDLERVRAVYSLMHN